MKYIDIDREKRYQDTKDSNKQNALTKTQEIRLEKHDIISNQGPPRKLDKIKLPDKSFKTREYHLISNLSFNDHDHATTLTGDKLLARARPNTVIYPQRGKVRDYNFISNKYLQNHDERISKETEVLKDRIAKTYWSNHNYDFIRTCDYDTKKEEKYKDFTTTQIMNKTATQQKNLPPA